MQWAEVIRDQSLQDLPYKIEMNEWGQIIMSPTSNHHGRRQVKIVQILLNLGGEVINECSIDTDIGVKVADVVWCSDDFVRKYGKESLFSEAPEICVEVISPSNSMKQMKEKMDHYFRRGAKECWLVSASGDIKFFDRDGELERSRFDVWH